ncbi:cubilin-like [Macrobrachium rosenbergii]|uniref:cubilin-like n=1 Tax=Macrobrachium rosenbergii TaxID=79674 RepID=UPI0034D4425A
MGINRMTWRVLWLDILATSLLLGLGEGTAHHVTPIDAEPDHIDANLLRTLTDDVILVNGGLTPNMTPWNSRAETGPTEVAKPKTEEEILMLKEKAFNEVLLLMGQRRRKFGPGQFCDEFITGEDFYIHSPSYPNNYPANTTCRYQIYRRHPDICGVTLTVLRLDLAVRSRGGDLVTNDVTADTTRNEAGECVGDSLTVGEVHHCGRYRRGQSALFTFPSSILTVEFRSGDTHGASGFLLLGRQVKSCRQPKSLGRALVSTVPCDRRIESDAFVISSPGYPKEYEDNVECHYVITRGEGVCGIDLRVEDFNLEDGSCMFDYLEVQGRRLCGKLQPGFTRYYDFEGPQLDIRFRSDESTRRGGFSISGRRVRCDEDRPLQSPLGQTRPGRNEDSSSPPLDSTTFPALKPVPLPAGLPEANFPPNIQTPAGTFPPNVQLAGPLPTNQSDIDISYILSVIGRRPITGLGKNEGPFGVDEKEGGAGGGGLENEAEEDFTELDPGLLTTDETTTNADQNIPGDPDFNPFTGTGLPPTLPTIPGRIPTTVPTTIPGRIPTSIPTTIPGRIPTTIPTVPGRIPTTIPTTIPGRIPTTFPTTSGRIPTTGTSIPGSVTSTFPTTFSTFPSTVDFPSTSVFPTFPTTTFAGEACDEVFAEQTFTVSSPGYPTAYAANLNCVYIVGRSSTDVCALQVTLIDVDLPDLDPLTGQCLGDYLDIGGTKICGTVQGRVLTFDFPDQTLEMNLHTDAATAGKGFRMEAKQLTDCGPLPPDPGQCDTITQQSAFMLLSPGYPAPYPSSTDCTTTVVKSSPSVVNLFLELVDFEITSSFGCSGDYVEVVGTGQRLCGQLTGQTRTYPFLGNSLAIRFHSGLQPNNGQRFRIRVTQRTSGGPDSCGGIISSSSYSIHSPSYPLAYPSDSFCTWAVFKVASNVCQLQVKLLDFDVEDSSGCAKDYLQVGYQERLCGRRYPGEIRTYHFSGNRLSLCFRSDIYGSGRGFSAEITQLTCGHFKPNYPRYPSYPSYPTPRPWYRPYRPTKPWYKPVYGLWWKKNPFSRPYLVGQGYTSYYGSESYGHDHNYTHYDSEHSHTGPHFHTTPSPFSPLTPLPTTPAPFPTVTPSPSPTPFPSPPPELLAAPLNNTTPVFQRPVPKPTLLNPEKLTASSSEHEVKTVTLQAKDDGSGMCNKATNGRTFQVNSPGYPGPYYTDMQCIFRVRRSDQTRCCIVVDG